MAITLPVSFYRTLFSYEPETLDWQSRVQAAGGTVGGSIAAIDTYIKSLKNDPSNPWAVMSNNGLIMPFCTDTFTAVMVPLIAPAGVVPSNVNFVSGDYSLATGLVPGTGTTSKGINTEYIPSTWLSLTSAQLSIYMREDKNAVSLPYFASNNGSLQRLLFHIKLGGTTYFDAFDALDGRVAVNIASSGLISGSRISASDSRIFRNGSSAASISTTSGTMPTTQVLQAEDDRPFSYIYVGPGLSATQEAAHYTAVQALQTALGRQV